jgi:hypothetical protein
MVRGSLLKYTNRAAQLYRLSPRPRPHPRLALALSNSPLHTRASPRCQQTPDPHGYLYRHVVPRPAIRPLPLPLPLRCSSSTLVRQSNPTINAPPPPRH